MVLKGQFLERATVAMAGGLALEALWHRGEAPPALLVCPPHPRSGASMDAVPCAELTWAASQRGHASLRFNYRGVGASQGDPGDLEASLADAGACLALLRHNVAGGPVAVVGIDFGAEVALGLARTGEAVERLVLVSPRPEWGRLAGVEAVEAPVLVVLGEEDRSWDGMGLAERLQARGDRLVRIPGADRAFTAGLGALGREVTEFLSAG